MATDDELLAYKIFHFIRFLLNVLIFLSVSLYFLASCFHNQLRKSKRHLCLLNICISMIFFSIINSVFALLPLAPNYETELIIKVCTLQHFLEDIVQGQVAYAFLAAAVYYAGSEQLKNQSFIWLIVCIVFQWLCSYLLPLPQILMSNWLTCLGIYSFENNFFPIYSLVFIFILPIFLHIIIYLYYLILSKSNIQVYPTENEGLIGNNDRVIEKYLLIMGLLFNIIGYGPKSLLATIDLNIQQSLALYSALEILPSFCLLIDIGLLFFLSKEVRKKISFRHEN